MQRPRHVFVTGPPGVGKSTLIRRVLAALQLQCGQAAPGQQQQQQQQQPGGGSGSSSGSSSLPAPVWASGFWTEEVRQGSSRAGFDVHALQGGRAPLARIGTGASRGAPAVGRYAVDVASFESVALPALRPAPGMRLLVVDEVGKMELHSASFFPAVLAALDTPGLVVLGTVPVSRQVAEAEAVKRRPDVQLVSVSQANRDELVATITQLLRQRLRL